MERTRNVRRNLGNCSHRKVAVLYFRHVVLHQQFRPAVSEAVSAVRVAHAVPVPLTQIQGLRHERGPVPRVQRDRGDTSLGRAGRVPGVRHTQLHRYPHRKKAFLFTISSRIRNLVSALPIS